MKLNRGRLNWGVFFIVLGAVPLAYRQGAVPLSTLSDAWRLWPLVLVGIGLKIVLSRTPAYFVGGLVVAACLGLVVGSLFAIGPQFGCGNQGGNASTTRVPALSMAQRRSSSTSNAVAPASPPRPTASGM